MQAESCITTEIDAREAAVSNKELKSKQFLTATELATYLNVSRKFVEKHVSDRRIPGIIKIGRQFRFRRADIDSALNRGQLLLPKEI